MLHCVVSRLLCDASSVGTNLLSDGLQAEFIGVMVSLEFLSASELVSYLIFHTVDIVGVNFHLLVHAALKVSDLFKISLTGLDFDLKRRSSALSLIELSLLEVQILSHLLDLVDVDTRQRGLTVQVLGHVLDEGCDSFLGVLHLSL